MSTWALRPSRCRFGSWLCHMVCVSWARGFTTLSVSLLQSGAIVSLPLRVPGGGRWPCGPWDVAALSECSTGSDRQHEPTWSARRGGGACKPERGVDFGPLAVRP